MGAGAVSKLHKDGSYYMNADYPYDYYKLIDTIPAEQAFRPVSEGNCPLVQGTTK